LDHFLVVVNAVPKDLAKGHVVQFDHAVRVPTAIESSLGVVSCDETPEALWIGE
jgi:hypothetical protein